MSRATVGLAAPGWRLTLPRTLRWDRLLSNHSLCLLHVSLPLCLCVSLLLQLADAMATLKLPLQTLPNLLLLTGFGLIHFFVALFCTMCTHDNVYTMYDAHHIQCLLLANVSVCSCMVVRCGVHLTPRGHR